MAVGVPSPGPVRELQPLGERSVCLVSFVCSALSMRRRWVGVGALASHFGEPLLWLCCQSPADRVQTLGAGLSTKMTSGHPLLPPALGLARHLGWPGSQASAAVSDQRAGVQWGLKRVKRSSPGTPRRPERTGWEVSRVPRRHGPAPEHQCCRELVRVRLPLELGKLRPERGRNVPKVTQHPRAASSPAVRPSSGSCSLGEAQRTLRSPPPEVPAVEGRGQGLWLCTIHKH